MTDISEFCEFRAQATQGAQAYRATALENGHTLVDGVEVFRAGDYPQGTWTADEVAAIAANYDPAWLRAPMTPDHEQDGEAWGWVESVRAQNGVLYANFTLRPIAAYLVRDGAYLNRSVEIYRKTALRDGTEGPYLKAISLLGACEPAVRGMAPIDMGDAVQTMSAQASEPAHPATPAETFQAAPAADIPTQEGTAMSPTPTPNVETPSEMSRAGTTPTQPQTVTAEEFAAINERLVRLQAENDAIRAEQYRRNETERFQAAFGSALSDGRVAPANRSRFESIFHALPSDVTVSDNGTDVPLRDFFLATFAQLPVLVSTKPVRVAAIAEAPRSAGPIRYGTPQFEAEVQRRAAAAYQANPSLNLRDLRVTIAESLAQEIN